MIKVQRCPKLKKVQVEGTSKATLSSLHIAACQLMSLEAVLKVIEESSPLDVFAWSDMFLQRGHPRKMDPRPHVEFLKKASKHVISLELQRFSINVLHRAELKPMETIFDEALLCILKGTNPSSASFRGSLVFSAIAIPHDTSVINIDASSCKNLQQIFAYHNKDHPDIELGRAKLKKLVLNDCSALETPTNLSVFYGLRYLSLQNCLLVTNDLLLTLPPCLEHLDLTGCKKIGDFASISWIDSWNENLSWCSFKATAVSATDAALWMLAAPFLNYLNLGQLQLQGIELTSRSLETLLLMNVDMSSPFNIRCPNLKELWLGNRYRGWPYEHEQNRLSGLSSPEIHGESLVQCIRHACSSVHLFLPEEFGVSFENCIGVSFTLKDFWTYGMVPSSWNGPAFRADWHQTKVESACLELKKILSENIPKEVFTAFSITIPKGPTPGILCAPYYNPSPPDSTWHTDYSQVGGGHDGGYVVQCESEWY